MLRKKILTRKFMSWVCTIIVYSVIFFISSNIPFVVYAFMGVFIVTLFFLGNPFLPEESKEEQMAEFSALRFFLWLLVVATFPFIIFGLCTIWPEYFSNIMLSSAPPILGFLFFFGNPLKNPLTRKY